MFKNTAAKFRVFAWDVTTGLAKTGDAANITAYVSKDYGAFTVLGDTSATEEDATNAKGFYLFDAAQAETNADCIGISAKSSTANIAVVGAPATIFTRPQTGWLGPAVAGRLLDVSVGGEAGIDWANIGSPTTAQNLSGTTVNLANTVTTLTNLPSIPANWITAAGINTGAFTAAKFAAGAIDAAALAADAGTEIAAAVWDRLTSALTTVGSIGKLLVDNVNATISSRSTHSAADVWAVATRILTAATNVTSTGAAVPITAGGLVSSDVTAISTDTGAADNLETAADGGSYNLGGGGVVAASVTGAVGSIAANGISATSIATGAFTAAKFAAGAFDAVWSVAARLLTAGTNIVLAKGTGVTGFNDLSAAQVNAEADQALADVGVTTTVTGRIDVAISTRLASAGYTAPDNASIAAILIDTAEIGAAGAGLTAITGKTDNLPSDPADASVVAGLIAAVDAKVDTIDGVVDAILVDTAEIGVAGAGLTNINLPDQTMNITGDISGNLSGSVGFVGAIGINAINAASIAPDAGVEIGNAVWASVLDGTRTAAELVRGFAAALLGKASGLPTAPKYRDIDDTKDVIDATTDTNGNRSAVNLDLS